MKISKYHNILLLFAGLLMLLNGCAKAPLNRLNPNHFPAFIDDSQTDTLLTGAVRHLHYLNKLPNDSVFTFGSDSYSISQLLD